MVKKLICALAGHDWECVFHDTATLCWLFRCRRCGHHVSEMEETLR